LDAALLGGTIITVLTQLISKAAEAVGAKVPPFVKQALALALSVGLIQFGGLTFPVQVHNPALQSTLDALVVWAVSMFAHDVANQYAPKSPLTGVGGGPTGR